MCEVGVPGGHSERPRVPAVLVVGIRPEVAAGVECIVAGVSTVFVRAKWVGSIIDLTDLLSFS